MRRSAAAPLVQSLSLAVGIGQMLLLGWRGGHMKHVIAADDMLSQGTRPNATQRTTVITLWPVGGSSVDGSVAIFPVRLAEVDLKYFAGGVARDCIDTFDCRRQLEPRKPLLAMRDDFFLRRVRTLSDDN